ncbi:MAG TPA: lactonase family protein [Mycobacteriales bacterium]
MSGLGEHVDDAPSGAGAPRPGDIGRRSFLGLVAAAAASFALPGSAVASPGDRPGWLRRAFLGGYTQGLGLAPGIGLATLDLRTGRAVLDGWYTGVANPFHLNWSRTTRTLYAVSDVPQGAVHALRADRAGNLAPLSVVPSGGAGPVYTDLDRTGRWLLTANYDSGSVAVNAVRPDGAIGERTALVQHTGSGPVPGEQAGPHPHMTVPDRTGERVLVPDKGTDTVHVYRLDGRRGLLCRQAMLAMPPASGPRHLVFHPSGEAVFLVNELSSTVSTLAYDVRTGALSIVGTTRTVGSDVPVSFPSAIVLSRDAHHLYVANRGADTISVLRVRRSGVELLDTVPVADDGLGAQYPWDLALSPDGRYLWSADTGGQALVTFRVEAQGAVLRRTGAVLATPTPTRILLT